MYFGSVRFFKHLIITIAVLAILLPYVTIIVFGVKYTEMRDQLESTRTAVNNISVAIPANMDNLHQQLDNTITTQNSSLKDELEAYMSDHLNALEKHTDVTINDKIDKSDSTNNKKFSALQRQLNSIDSKLLAGSKPN